VYLINRPSRQCTSKFGQNPLALVVSLSVASSTYHTCLSQVCESWDVPGLPYWSHPYLF
jgi:hypothetical protein